MTKDIVGKLTEFLKEPIDSECKVVYLLAEVRKLLERHDPKHTLGALWMYCHWALHVDLSRPSTTGTFLDTLDRWITNKVAYLPKRSPWSFEEELELFRNFIYLSAFRQQLSEFLAAQGIETSLCTEDAQWNLFLREYSGVIEDGTMTICTKNSPLVAVDKVTFEKGPALTSDHHVPFVIRWTIQLQDGRTLKTSLETVPDGAGHMTLHEIQITNNGFTPPHSA